MMLLMSMLGVVLELSWSVRCSNECDVVCVCKRSRVLRLLMDVVDAKKKESSRKCAALWDAVRDCLCFGLGVLGV